MRDEFALDEEELEEEGEFPKHGLSDDDGDTWDDGFDGEDEEENTEGTPAGGEEDDEEEGFI